MDRSDRNRRCWGRMGYFLLGRCGRRGDWFIFCHDHKNHGLLVPLLLLLLMSVVADYLTVSTGLRGPTRDELELQATAYTDISLACHWWKNDYMTLYPGGWAYFSGVTGYDHVWDELRGEPKPEYSSENWARFRPLFGQGIDILRQRLQEAVVTYGDVLAPSVRSNISEIRLQLTLEQSVYSELDPNNFRLRAGDPETFYRVRFESVLQMLENLDDQVQELRDELQTRLTSQ